MARTQQLQLDLPIDPKATAVKPKGGAALAAKAVNVPSEVTKKGPDFKRLGRKKGEESDLEPGRLAETLPTEDLEAVIAHEEGVQWAQAGASLPGLDDAVGSLTDQPLQFAQLELPTLPTPSSSAGAASSGAASSAAAGGLGSLGAVFGAVAGLGMAAGGGGGAKSAGSSTPVVQTGPTTSAPVPTAPASAVISLFSDSYTNVPVKNWNPGWDWQTGDLSEGRAVNGNAVKRVTQLGSPQQWSYQPVEIATLDASDIPVSGVLNVSEKGYLHIDIWLEQAGSLTLELVSKDGAAAEMKDQVSLSGEIGWNSFDINLAQMDSVDLSNIIRLVFYSGGEGSDFKGTVSGFHFDNLYFAGTYAAALEGRLVNGYIENAEVFQDFDGDGVLDNDRDIYVEPGEEPYTLTDTFGRFNLVGAVPGGGSLIAQPTANTVDKSTGLTVTNVFKAPEGASVISPLSTLLEAGSKTGLTEAQLKTAFGIDASVDLLDFNPVQAIEDAATSGDLTAANLALKMKAANVTVSNLMDVGSNLIAGAAPSATNLSAAVVSSLVSAVKTATAPLNLASDTAVETILSRAASTAGVSTAALSNLTAVISSAADQLSALTSRLNDAQSTVNNASQAMAALTTMAKVEQVAQSTLSDRVKTAAQTPSSVSNLTNLDLADAVSKAQVTVQTFKTLGFESSEGISLSAFNGATATTQVSSGNTVVKVIKPAGAADQYNASGLTVSTGTKTVGAATLNTLPALDLMSEPRLGMWVNSARAGTTVTLEVGDSARGGWPNDGNFVAARGVTTKAGWDYVSFDFSKPIERYVEEGEGGAQLKTTTLKGGVTYDMLNVFFDLGQSKSADQTYYFDKLGYFTSSPGTPPADIANELAPARPADYNLVWSDDFGGDFVSGNSAAPKTAVGSQWAAEIGRGPNNDGWGNGEQQIYTDSINNAYVQNGALHIVADKTGSSITSARLKSVPDVGPNAYVEIRAKVPVGSGAWPAAWLLGQGQWPDTGEIDIMEWSSAYFNPNQTQSALHFRGENNPVNGAVAPTDPAYKAAFTYGDTQKKGITTLGTPVTDFHTYQVWWTQNSIKFGVDSNSDNAYYTYTKPANATTANWPFTGPMDLILNLAIGGSLGGNDKVPSSNFNYEMVVDWVKVYQGPNGPTSGPTAPTELQANVKSLFSDSYTAVPTGGTTWSTVWDVVTDPEGVTLSGNAAKKYAGVSYIGIEPSTTLNVSDMDTFHMDVWRTDATAEFEVKLVDFGADGAYGGDNDVEGKVIFNSTLGNAIAAGQWVSLDIPLSQFTGLTTKNNFAQLILSSRKGSVGSGETLWIDNAYFSKTAVTEAPYTGPANVKNTFSASTGVVAFGDAQAALLAANSADRPAGSSGSVMRFVKPSGAQPWAGVTIATLTDSEFVITGGSKVSLRVWSPAAGKTVMLKLEDSSNSNNNVEISATTTVAQGWQTLVFDASTVAGFNNSHVYNKASVFFDFLATAAGQTYYFDDLAFDKYLVNPSNVNAFSDAGVYASKKFDFEGADSTVISSGTPAGSDGAVVKSIKTPGGQPYAGSVIDSLSAGEYISSSAPVVNLRVWSPDAGKTVRMKLEDASAPGTKFVEADAITTVSGGWQTLSFDFSRASGINHSHSYDKALVFFDFMAGASGQTYYFDNLSHNQVAQINSAVTFESNDTTGYLLGAEPWDFGGNASSRVDIPAGLGDSAGGAFGKVAKVINGSEPWSGTTFLNLPNGELISAGKELVSMRVYAPESNKKVMLKLEDREFPEKFKEVAVSTSTVGWQTLNFDFSGADHSVDYNKASIFFDFYSDATGSHPGKVYYFDDVKFGSAYAAVL